MPYKESSYAEVLLWLQDTEIYYVPKGKKAGTKSYDRYEKYSQAKNVAQALEFGSKPVDLLHDLEKGLLKRVGGPRREKPLNLAEVADTSTLSKTDLIIGKWGYMVGKKGGGEGGDGGEGAEKAVSSAAPAGTESSLKQRRMEQKAAYKRAQLSVQFGVKAEHLAQGTSWAESPAMVGMRSKANVEAASILETAEAEGRGITDADVLRVLRLWAVKKNGDRKNVMPEGMTTVHSETIGLLHCSGARLIPTLHVAQYPKVLTLFSKWMKDNRPEGHTQDFPFTSIIVNSSYAAKRHRDHLNLGPSVVKAFGEFQGGDLRYWAEDDNNGCWKDFEEKDAVTINVRDGAAVIDGNRAHAVDPYTGDERFSLVFFTTHSHEKATAEVREQLFQVGIPVPDEEAMTYLKGLLPAPQGYAHYTKRHRRTSEGSGQQTANSVLAGLRKLKTGLKLGKMLGGKAAGGAGEKGEPKKILTPLASKGLLARVLAKRALGDNVAKQSAPGGQKPVKQLLKKPVKQLRPGGLLARVQMRSQEPAACTAESTPGADTEVDTKSSVGPSSIEQPGGLGLFARVQKLSQEAAGSVAESASAGGTEADHKSNVGPSSVDQPAAPPAPVAKPSVDQPAAPPAPVAKPAKAGKKPLAFGGLLARVQQKRACPESSAEPGLLARVQQQKRACPEPSPEPTPGPDCAEGATPERKRPRGSETALSDKKAAAPPNPLKRCFADAIPQEPAEVKPRLDVAAIQKDCGSGVSPSTACQDGTSHHFLHLATVLSSTSNNSAVTLAECLRNMAKDANGPQAVLRAAMALMVPAEPVSGCALAAAVAEAFGVPCDARVQGEALAAKALEARQCKEDLQSTSPLTLVEVAEGRVVASRSAADEDFGLAASSLAKLLAKTQSGMEASLLVRALQGKLSQSKDVTHRAIAQALVPVN